MKRVFIRGLAGARWGVIAAPYLWMLVFFAIPFLIVLKISFAERATAMPPYTPLLAVAADGAVSLKLHLGAYLALLRDSQYVAAYLSSIKIAAISTALALLIGYPMAYVIARLPLATRNVAMMLVVLPSWTMIGRVLWGEFFNNRDWPVAAAVATVMLLLLLLPIVIFHRYQQRELEGRLT
ncbi:hypothetical protein GUF65_08830 [Xanthomonas citri pv. citri]|nr:hypothetical protein [Xanthomonas citri pv. citri]